MTELRWLLHSSSASSSSPPVHEREPAEATAVASSCSSCSDSSPPTLASCDATERASSFPGEWTAASRVSSPAARFVVLLPVSISAAAALLLLLMTCRRRRTRAKLERCGLPTVYWRPRLASAATSPSASWLALLSRTVAFSFRTEGTDGAADAADSGALRVLRSSNITNILPRMKRLEGPYGMYGTVYGVNVAVVHVAHPVPAGAILALNPAATSDGRKIRSPCSQATKAPAYDHFKNFCGDGVFTADGDDWRRKRAAVLHVLLRSTSSPDQDTADSSPRRRGSSIPSFETKVELNAHLAAEELTVRLDRLLDDASAASGEGDGARGAATANVVPLLQRATIGLIYRYLTHCDLPRDDETDDGANTKGDAGSVPVSGYKGYGTNSPGSLRILLPLYLQSITRIRMIILAQSRSIWFLLPRWCYRRFSSLFREEERTMGPIRAFSTLACLSARPGSPLHALPRNYAPYNREATDPRERKPPTQSFVNRSVGEATNVSKHLLDEAITLLFAGQDTSAATLSWTLHLLSLYPLVQNKVAQEVLSMLEAMGDEQARLPLTRKGLSQMPYLDAVVKESMRLYPVAPFVVRRLPFDVPIPLLKESDRENKDCSSSLVLPKDSLACIWIYSLHRHGEFWKDPNAFRPERWLETEASRRDPGISNGAYMPFAAGPRNCVGQPLAQIILRSLLARLVSQFEFRDARLHGGYPTTDECADGLRKDMQAGFTVLPEGGVELRVTRRRDADRGGLS